MNDALFQTTYSKAWHEYTETQEYQRMVISMIKSGMKQPYINHVLQNAFAAGWRATGVKIKQLNNGD